MFLTFFTINHSYWPYPPFVIHHSYEPFRGCLHPCKLGFQTLSKWVAGTHCFCLWLSERMSGFDNRSIYCTHWQLMWSTEPPLWSFFGKGVLIAGPPDSGKSAIASAIAGFLRLNKNGHQTRKFGPISPNYGVPPFLKRFEWPKRDRPGANDAIDEEHDAKLLNPEHVGPRWSNMWLGWQAQVLRLLEDELDELQ